MPVRNSLLNCLPAASNLTVIQNLALLLWCTAAILNILSGCRYDPNDLPLARYQVCCLLTVLAEGQLWAVLCSACSRSQAVIPTAPGHQQA